MQIDASGLIFLVYRSGFRWFSWHVPIQDVNHGREFRSGI